MAPRPRKASDEQVFAAAYRAMQELGPGELTLAAIAREAGVTASALVQRFGSKRNLLLALAERSADEAAGFFVSLQRESGGSPLSAIRTYGRCLAQMAASPTALARSLAYLEIDLSDEAFRLHLHRQAAATRVAVEAALAEAVRRKELLPVVDPVRLARLLEAVSSGALLTWAIDRTGTAGDWMEGLVNAVLAPYLPPSAGETKTNDGP